MNGAYGPEDDRLTYRWDEPTEPALQGNIAWMRRRVVRYMSEEARKHGWRQRPVITVSNLDGWGFLATTRMMEAVWDFGPGAAKRHQIRRQRRRRVPA